MKVLVSLDGAPSSQNALRAVGERPWPAETEFTVISVVDSFVTADLPALVKGAENAAEDIVAKAAKTLEERGLKVKTAVPHGYPAPAILETATSLGADLVMVGSHGVYAVPRFLLGSTALRVVRNAPCAVEIVRCNKHRFTGPAVRALKILLATDGGACSLNAAKFVAQRPWPAGTEVRVMCVPEAVKPLLENQIATAVAWEELLEMRRAQARDAVDVTSKVFAGSRLTVHTDVPAPLWGPKAAILEEAENWPADMIVLGSHGRQGFERFWMGSVSEAVALNAPCSVEVVRPTQK